MNTIYAEYNMYHNSIDIYTIFIVSGTIVFKLHNIIRRIQSIQKSIRRAVFPFTGILTSAGWTSCQHSSIKRTFPVSIQRLNTDIS